MKKLFEDENILVQVDEITHIIYVTNKNSAGGVSNYVRVEGYKDGHLTVLAPLSRLHALINGFSAWLN